MAAMEFLPDLTPQILDEHQSWLEPAALELATGKLIFCFQSYLVRTPHHVVLIDSCVGNDKNRPTRPNWHMKTGQTYMSALASAGSTVEDIDYVMCTHLHPDHVGWNTRLENGCWVPTFPNARYVLRLHRRQCSADRRGKSGRVGPQRSCPQRSCPIAADARAYARPFRRAPRQVGSRRRRDRRSYPLTLAGPLSRAFVQTRLRSAASGPDPPCIFGTLLRQRNTVLHVPLSITVGGSYRSVERRISLRERRGHRGRYDSQVRHRIASSRF
jgi:Metallo-beta-lactamase superfamily